MIIIDISPLGSTLWQSEIDGEVIGNSRTPMLSTARILRMRGVPADTQIGVRRKGKTHIEMLGTVGSCAYLTVSERKTIFGAWQPFSRDRAGRPEAVDGEETPS